MNVLFLDHCESDYGSAFLFNGLCRVIGPENIYDFPLKYSYHGIDHRYSTSAIENGFTSPLPWMPAWSFAWSEEERQTGDGLALLEGTRKRLREGFFDLVVMGSMREIAMSSFFRLEPEIRRAGIPIVVHEGEDFQQICKDHLAAIRPTLHLKREVPKSNAPSCDWRVIPFPFSFPDNPTADALYGHLDAIAAVPKSDVIFMCGGTWDARFDMLRVLDEAGDLNAVLGTDGTSQEKIPNRKRVGDLAGWWEYLQRVSEARIGVSVRGFGYDTCRFWETAYCTLLAHDRPDLQMEHPYTAGVNCMEFNDPGDFLRQARSLLAQDRAAEYDAMKTACLLHTRKYHTNSARARQMLAAIGMGV